MATLTITREGRTEDNELEEFDAVTNFLKLRS